MRFFFDYATTDRSLYDYHGSEFQTSHGAFDFAEAIAQDLRNRLSGEWNNWSIEVCTPEGKKLISIRVAPTGSSAIGSFEVVSALIFQP